MTSLTVGKVESNYDEEQQGKVQVSLPRWNDGGDTTAWLPVVSPYAGGGYGMYWMPEAGDTVIVGFLDGDVHSGVVLGSYWNKSNAIPSGLQMEGNELKAVRSKTGHTVTFSDEDDGYVTVTTKGGLKISMTDEDKKVTISNKDGKAKMVLDGDGTKVEIIGDTEIKLKGGDIKLEGNNISIKGSDIKLNSDGGLKLEGKTVELKGTNTKLEGTSFEAKGSNVKVESSGMLTLKGSMTKIN